MLPSIIDAAERDPELAELHARLHAQLIGAFRAVIERAQHKGELSPNINPADIVAAIIGPLFYRRWFSREPLDAQFVKGITERVVGMFKSREEREGERDLRE